MKPAEIIAIPAQNEVSDLQRDLLAQYAYNVLLGRISFPISVILIGIAMLQWCTTSVVFTWIGLCLFLLVWINIVCKNLGDGSCIKNKKDYNFWYASIAIPRLLYMCVWSSIAFWAWTPDHIETYYIAIAILTSTMAMKASQSASVMSLYIIEVTPKMIAIFYSAFVIVGGIYAPTIAMISVLGLLTFTKIAFGINKAAKLSFNQKYEIIKSKDEIEQASRAKSAFLATMSHEVRTPLNGILGIISLLKYTRLSPQQNEYVETIKYSGETLLAMLNDILDFSKMEAGKLELDIVPVETMRLLQSVVELMLSRANEKKVFIRSEVFDNVPRYIRTDPTRLRQVLLNLTSNAIKFTENGGVSMTVQNLNPDVDYSMAGAEITLRFSVRDTGVGIPEEAKEKLFTEFTQVDSSISRKYGGTGLGLSICKKIVDIMNGKILFESSHEGSVFWFDVAVNIASKEDITNTSDINETYPILKPLNILVAEDNLVNQKIIEGLLCKYKHKVHIVNNGQEAVDAVREKKYDLILMDMQMPLVDGLEASAKIRAMGGINSLVPIIALTANNVPENVDQYSTVGISDHISKPMKISKMFQTIAQHFPDRILSETERRSFERLAKDSEFDDGVQVAFSK